MPRTFTKLLSFLVCICVMNFANAQADGMVTLTVDMSQYANSFTTVYLSGSYNGWSGDANPMTDNGDGTWTTTVMMTGGDQEYKFTYDNWAGQEQFDGSESCTITDGTFANRYLSVDGDATVDAACFNSCSMCPVDGMITFTVDVSEYPDPVTGVFLAGSFNGWSGDANPMTDNGDSTWTGTVMLPAGDQEYKFVVDGAYEGFEEGEPCTVTNGGFTNRVVAVDGDATVDEVCYNSCNDCGVFLDGMVTLSVDMSEYTTAFTQMYLSGSFNGWSGDANAMTDNGDGIWSITLMMPGGPHQYKFTHDNWAGQENFAGGESCTITDGGFTNRFIEVDGDETVGVNCFNSCDICSPPVDGMMTFTVDVSEYPDPVMGVFFTGSFNGWSGDANPMTDNGDSTWTITLMLPAGDQEYKFVVDGAYEGFEEGEPCTVTNGGFTNRVIAVDGDATVDVVCYNSCNACGVYVDGMVTLSVDMNEYTDPFTTVYVSGTFNGWSGDANPMTDNGDGTWTTTIMMPGGDQQYKFQLDQWAAQEEFMGGESCTVPDGPFVNRGLTVDGDETVGVVCFNSCDICSPPVDGMITLSVDMNEYTTAFTTMYLSGSYNGWSGDANPMTDNGDGTWSITVLMPAGDNRYKFTHDNWAGQETFAGGESCTNTNMDGFTDRVLSVNGDATIDEVCFNSCFECGASVEGMVTLTVDMTEYADPFVQMYLSGSFNGWSGDANPMTDNGDGTWSITVLMPAGANEYKFTIDDWAVQEEFAGGESCTVTSGDFTNRFLEVNGDATVDVVCFNSCFVCGADPEGNITFNVDMSDYTDAFTTVYISGGFNGWSGDANPMTDNGDGTWTTTIQIAGGDQQYKFQVDQWTDQEQFAGGEPCTAMDGAFVNRVVAVAGDAVLDLVCFNSCEECDGVEDPEQCLTLDFELPNFAYTIFPFGQVTAEKIANPDATGLNTSDNVLQLFKPENAEVWGGTAIPLDCFIDFSQSNMMELHIWSPRAGVPVLLKIEDTDSPEDMNGNPSVFAEVMVNTATSNAWELMMFDMSTHPDFSDAADLYDQVVVFADFNNAGVVGGETFYFDNIKVAGDVAIDETELAKVQLDAFPNPVDEVLNVSFDIPVAGNATLTLVDVLGRTAKHVDMDYVGQGATNQEIAVNTLSSGTYVLLLRLDNQLIKTKNIVIK